MVHYYADEFIAQGDRLVMLGRCAWRNRQTGRIVKSPRADFLRMRDGKISSFFEFYDTAKTLSATIVAA